MWYIFIFVYIFYDTKIYIKKEEEYMLLMELEAKWAIFHDSALSLSSVSGKSRTRKIGGDEESGEGQKGSEMI